MNNKYPDNNPKTAVGATKVPLHLIPPSAKYYLALALENGASKYGSYNWRDRDISISVYKAAMERHMDAYWDGEDIASDSGVHHVAHAMTCCALLLDAMSIGKLHDDRPTKGASPRLQEEYTNNTKENNGRESTGSIAYVDPRQMELFDKSVPYYTLVDSWIPNLQAHLFKKASF